MIDTARLWIPTILLFIPNGFFLYAGIAIFPPSLVLFLGYLAVFYSLRKEARYLPFVIPILLIQSAMILFTSLNDPIVWIPFIPFAIIMIVNLVQSRRETNLFDRTILSLNDTDRKKARKAMKTRNLEDIAEVAEYTDWAAID